MFAAARKAAQSLISSSKLDKAEALALPSECLPERYSLHQLHDETGFSAKILSEEDELETLLILNACLEESSRLAIKEDDDEFTTKLAVWIATSILPDGTLVLNDEAPEDSSSASKQESLLLTQQKAALGLRSLIFLLTLFPLGSDIDTQILLSVIAFCSPNDPWSTPLTAHLSNEVLSHHKDQTSSLEFITTYLLQSVLRPLFSKSHPSTITESGRKAMPSSAPPKRHDFVAERNQKPWKYEAPYSIAVFSWAVSNASEHIIKSSWNLFIPPLLTLLDDTSNRIRYRGLLLLSSLLPRFPKSLLEQTGLDSVFEEAVMPTLLYLPNLTPVEESVALLPAAYRALFVLGDVRFPLSSPPQYVGSLSLNGKTKEEKDYEAKKDCLKFLDRIMRQGVLTGYAHSSKHPAIAKILVQQIGVLVQKMGVHAVKHLKDMIPILSTILADSFGALRPSLLFETVKTLQAMILNTWPRMSEQIHRVEAIKALVLCWKTINEDESTHTEAEQMVLGDLRKEIGVAGRLLVKAAEGDFDMVTELRPIMEVDRALIESVFGITSTAARVKDEESMQ